MVHDDGREQEVMKALEAVAEECRGKGLGDKEWTRRVKDALVPLGRARGCKCYASECSADGGEWLYDLTWLKMGGENDKHVRDVDLILESEWNMKDQSVMDDFPKLVLGRAKLRVFIFTRKTTAQFEEVMRWVLDEINGSAVAQEGDRYLFACWIIGEQKFRFEPYTVPAT